MANVLIVDDSAIMRVNIRSILKGAGHEVVGEAENAREAYFKYGKFKPDIVTMDVNMPGMNGIDVTKKITDKYPEAKVIIVSSFEEKNLVVDALEAGAKHYILKPITPKKLLNRMNQVLNPYKYMDNRKNNEKNARGEFTGTQKCFKINNNKGIFEIDIPSDLSLNKLRSLHNAVMGLLCIEPLSVVMDFGQTEELELGIYNGIVEVIKKMYDVKAAVEVIVRTKSLAKFMMHNTINSFAKVCSEIEKVEGEKNEGSE